MSVFPARYPPMYAGCSDTPAALSGQAYYPRQRPDRSFGSRPAACPLPSATGRSGNGAAAPREDPMIFFPDLSEGLRTTDW